MYTNVKFFLLFLLFVLSCNDDPSPSVQDCGTSYEFDDPSKEMDKPLVAKINFVIFLSENEEYFDDTIKSSMELLNSQLSPVTFDNNLNISFELGNIMYLCSEEYKENMPDFIKHAHQFNQEGMFNIYVYGDRQPYMVGEQSAIRGRAAGIISKTIAIRRAFLNSSTITHEMLHCLGLRHVHEKDETDGLNIDNGDLVCDTRSISVEDFVDGNCNYLGPSTNEEVSNLTCNIMSYVTPQCRNCLSEGQAKRVKFIIYQSPIIAECFGIKRSNI